MRESSRDSLTLFIDVQPSEPVRGASALPTSVCRNNPYPLDPSLHSTCFLAGHALFLRSRCCLLVVKRHRGVVLFLPVSISASDRTGLVSAATIALIAHVL